MVRLLQGGDGGDEFPASDLRVFRGKGGAQEEDRLLFLGASQLDRLSEGGDGKDLDARVEG